MGNLPGEDRLLADLPAEQRRASFDLLHGIPDEVEIVLEREGIDCDYRKGGVLYCAARYPEQEASLRHYLDTLFRQGLTENDYRWLSPEQLAQQIRIAKPYGGIHAPHVATINPAKLVRGLARTVERMGINIYENSPVTQWQSGSLRTAKAQVRSRWIVPAVEGYAATLPPLDRYQLPVQSLLVATEPLSAATWDEIGLSHGQAFSESSRQVTYGQRTADNRLVFGARGGYQFAGKLRRDFDLTTSEIELRRYLFSELFPAAQERPNHPCLGRQPGYVSALQAAHALRSGQRHRRVRRLWRGGCRCQQPRRANPGRPDSSARYRVGPPAVGYSSGRSRRAQSLGTRAPAAGWVTTRSSAASSTKTRPWPTRPPRPGDANWPAGWRGSWRVSCTKRRRSELPAVRKTCVLIF